MKTRLLPLLVGAATLSACAAPPPPPPETAFIRDFSLGEAVVAIAAPQLHASSGGSGGGYSGMSDGAAMYRSHFELVFDLREGSRGPFDQAAFIAALRGEVEKAARAGGIRITRRGDAGTVDLRYDTPEGHVGLAYVYGMRIEGGQYRLRGEILETIRPARRS